MVGHPTNSGRLFNIYTRTREVVPNKYKLCDIFSRVYIYIYVYVCMSVYICIYKIVKTIKCLDNWEQGSVRRMESEWNLIRQRVKTEFG